MAALAGRRLVTSSETNEGTRLNEARIKALTGCDPVTARFLHAEFFTFVPVAKYWLAVNHRPVVKDDSLGFWRRVRLLPFTRRFQGIAVDPRLSDALRTELPGILAWAVAGALEWQKRGLGPPEAVRVATEGYRIESDPLAQFLDERCLCRNGSSVGATEFFRAYRGWAVEQGFSERETLTATAFGARMSAKFDRRRSRHGNRYWGIGLLSEYPDSDERAADDGLVQGWVQGCEPDDHEMQVLSPEDRLSRDDLQEPYTTLHPAPPQFACHEPGDAS